MTRHPLRQYQEHDVDVIATQRPRVLNAYDCGLGKTLVATRAVERADTFPALITCPTYLTDMWSDHLMDEGYRDDEIVMAATTATRAGKIQAIGPEEKQRLLSEATAEPHVKWVIVNHEMLRQSPKTSEKSVQQIWRDTQREMGWDLQSDVTAPLHPKRATRIQQRYKIPLNVKSLILDESHRFRGSGPSGRGSQQFRGAYQVATRHKIQLVQLLTATPIYKDVSDLYNQLRFIDPQSFTSRWAFLNAYALLDEDPWGAHVVGVKPAAAKLLPQYGIVRRYTDPDVQLEIPPLISRVIRCTMSPQSTKRHAAIKDHFRNPQGHEEMITPGRLLPMLRNTTAMDPAKLDALDSLLADLPPDAGRIIFTYYRETAQFLANRLHLPLAIGGQKGNTQLAKSQNALVANIDCLQEGVDLSHLRAVIFYEEDYLPGKRKQAYMRVQRFRTDPQANTTDPVLVYWIVARASIDERVHKVASGRGASADEIMNLELGAA